MPLLLCRHLDKRTEWKVVVAEDSFTIGSSATATVPVPDSTIDATEAAVRRRGDRFVIRDLAEKGRVELGENVVNEALLRNGDRICIGRIAIVFFEEERPEGQQVDLFRDDSPARTASSAAILATGPTRGRGRRRSLDLELSRAAKGGLLLASFAAGFFIAAFGSGRAKEAPPPPVARPREAPRTESSPPPARVPGEPPSPAAATPQKQAESAFEEALWKLKTELDTPPSPQRRTREAEPPSASPRSPAIAPDPPLPAGKYTLGLIDDPVASRVSLFRLFLDLAGRAPTRAEERELTVLTHEERWRRIIEAAGREKFTAGLDGPMESQFVSLLGRTPLSEELREVGGLATAERPASLWITSLEEYRSPPRKRQRSAATRARRLIVDLLDRPPASTTEIEVVLAAIREPAEGAEVIRTLAYSADSLLPQAPEATSGSQPAWWEEEVVRFLLRAPLASERESLTVIIDGLPPASRRRWLVLALAGREDYASY